MHDLKVKLTDLELLCLRFTLKYLGPHYFKIHLLDLVHVCYDDRCWSKILLSTIPTPMHDIKVKVTDLELLY